MDPIDPAVLERLLRQPTVSVPEAGAMLGMHYNAAYRAARDGRLPSIRVSSRVRVPTAALKRMLGLDEPASAR